MDIPTGNDFSETIAQIAKTSFVRVQGRAKFTDAEKINTLLNEFNSLGESIAYVTKSEEIKIAEKALNILKETIKDKSKLAEAIKQQKQASDVGVIAKELGLHHDPKFLEHLRTVIKFGFSDQLEIQQVVDGVLYTACLKRECLRETDDLIIRKYSRKTEKTFVVLGVVTQTASESTDTTSIDAPPPTNMKAAISNLIDHMANMETSLSGKASNEVIIDPIAVYVSLN